MAKVLGIGGVFFKAKDPDALRDWYRRVLGITVTEWGGVMFEPLPAGVTVWTPFAADTEHFLPSIHDTMFNYVVDDLDGVLALAAAEGVTPLSRDDSGEYGHFAWVLDPEGRKVELWQPATED